MNPDITLQPHQERVRAEAEEAARTGTPYRKLLLWGTGSGKSLGALGIADALQAPATVVGPAALRQTLKGESLKALGHADFPVSSYQAAARGKVAPAETLLVDEAQRLGSAGSAQARAVGGLAQNARNVILMSATPVRNRPEEFAPLLSALTGRPVSHDEFADRYVGTESVRPGGLIGRLLRRPAFERPTITHADELRDMLDGKVDYYEPTTPPVDVKHETVEAELTPRQADLYRGMMGRLPWVIRQKLKWRYPLSDQELLRARSFLTGPRQVALSDLPYRTDKDPLKAFRGSGKLTKAYERLTDRLKDERAKAIVYSNFLEAGLRPYAAALAANNVPHAVFHGGLSDAERKKLVDDFNSNKLRVALVAPAGAEGISLKGAQLVQLLDNYWNSARNTQAQARGIRFDSHTGLPEDLKNVTVERYVGRLPLPWHHRLVSRLGVDREAERETIDDYLGRMANQKDELNNQLIAVLRQAARRKQASRSAVIVKGNPKYIADNPRADAFYADLAKLLSSRNYEVTYDPGDEYTVPPAADLWVGHSRGADRLRFAPPATQTIAVGSGLPGAVNHARDVVDRPAGSFVPPSAHYQLSRDMRQKLDALIGGKQAAAPDPVDRENCPHCGASMERDPYAGTCNRCGKDWPAATKTKYEFYCETCLKGFHTDPPANKCPACSGDPVPYRALNAKSQDRVLASERRAAKAASFTADDIAVVVKLAALVPGLMTENPDEGDDASALRAAKLYSDAGNYRAKVDVLRRLVRKDPASWAVDSYQDATVGLTHVPSGWRYHLPKSQIVDLLPQADPIKS